MLSADDQANRQQIIDDFHRIYYDGFETTWEQTHWKGVKILKCPLDLWVYSEILWEQKPDLVLETGTAHGGSALWFADMLDLIGHGEVISIDIAGRKFFPNRPDHDRISYIENSSTDPELVTNLHTEWAGKNVLVILDSAHDRDHVLRELHAWNTIVPLGGYLIVEDTNVHGHPVLPEHVPGPTEAIEAFMDYNDRFEIDRAREKYMMTFNPGGYLRRFQ